MIERYSRKELTRIWEEKNKYRIWLDIELAAVQGMEKIGLVPKGVSKKLNLKLKLILTESTKLKPKLNTM